jgi:hypothetical protein
MKSKTLSVAAGLLSLLLIGSGIAQKSKKWTEWNKQETQKMLENSPWAKMQTDTDTSEQMYSPTTQPGVNGARTTSNDDTRLKEGATNQATNVNYAVRFFSARPIREALIRTLLLNNAGTDAATITQYQAWAEAKAQGSIIVTVSFKAGQGSDQRTIGPVMQAFNSAVTATLKNKTYLQRSDGKQLFLETYVPPGKDGFGARFIFLRMPDEKLFLDSSSKEIRFFTDLGGGVKVDRRFKVADMMYEGELEY